MTDRPRFALLAAPETSPSVLYGLYDVLLSAGAVYPDMTTGEPGEALLDVSPPFYPYWGNIHLAKGGVAGATLAVRTARPVATAATTATTC